MLSISASGRRAIARSLSSKKNQYGSLFLRGNNLPQQQCCPSLSLSFSSLPDHEVVGMPALSPTMDAGSIATWNVKEGDFFSAGMSLAEIETDKATMDFEAQDDGFVAKILKDNASGEIQVGSPIVVTVDEEGDIAAFKDFVLEESSDAGSDNSVVAAAESSSDVSVPELATEAPKVAKEHLLMPSARHLSQSKGLDATGLKGTGKDGRITKGDVIIALKNGVVLPPLTKTTEASAPAPAATTTTATAAPSTPPPPTTTNLDDVIIPTITTSGSYKDTKNNNMRKVIARRLTESKSSVPHFYSTIEIELDNIMALRKKLKEKDIKVSVNDLIIRGSALALRDVPEVNASYTEANGGEVKSSSSIDISVAVATPGGLITPIVPNTDQLGLMGISDKVKDLATRARDGKLSPEEYQGGTFCISNLGMFGISEFSAVINPPQAAILAVGGGVKKVVVNTPYVDGAEEQEKPTVKNVMSARLSADRRVVDEPTVALFLSALKCYLNKPELLLL